MKDSENQNIMISDDEENAFLQDFSKTTSDNSDQLHKPIWLVRTEDIQIHNQESTEFTVQTEQESSREEQVPVEKFIWHMINNKFSITSEDDYKTELDNELSLTISNVITAKEKLKKFQILRLEEQKKARWKTNSH